MKISRHAAARVRHDVGILAVTPSEPLSAEDFAIPSREVDPSIERAGSLEGLLLEAPRFPGWRNRRAFLAPLRFVQDHHGKIRRIAVVSDDRVLAIVAWYGIRRGRGQALPGGRARRSRAVARGPQAWHLSGARSCSSCWRWLGPGHRLAPDRVAIAVASSRGART